ncbi:hypothetical protein [Kribbella sp. NBC_00359]|uniref:hypothetical protein n=1 Tax=Kribbella sp. NBC_00359 TaxID=2975966 RepID=UPI002E1A8EA1
MKHIYTLVAVPVLTCGAVIAGASQASATNVDPEPGAHGEGFIVITTPGPRVSVDDTVTEVLQTGAGALGGAGIAVAAFWAYRRRHPISVH